MDHPQHFSDKYRNIFACRMYSPSWIITLKTTFFLSNYSTFSHFMSSKASNWVRRQRASVNINFQVKTLTKPLVISKHVVKKTFHCSSSLMFRGRLFCWKVNIPPNFKFSVILCMHQFCQAGNVFRYIHCNHQLCVCSTAIQNNNVANILLLSCYGFFFEGFVSTTCFLTCDVSILCIKTLQLWGPCF